MVTYEQICDKLGFDVLTYEDSKDYSDWLEDDPRDVNPFEVLTSEELTFLTNFIHENKR